MASAPPPRGTPGLDYALFSRNSSVGANTAVNNTNSPIVTDDDATDPLGCSLDTEPSPRSPRTPFGQIARERARRAREQAAAASAAPAAPGWQGSRTWVCPQCGETNWPALGQCHRCGGPRPPASAAPRPYVDDANATIKKKPASAWRAPSPPTPPPPANAWRAPTPPTPSTPPPVAWPPAPAPSAWTAAEAPAATAWPSAEKMQDAIKRQDREAIRALMAGRDRGVDAAAETPAPAEAPAPAVTSSRASMAVAPVLAALASAEAPAPAAASPPAPAEAAFTAWQSPATASPPAPAPAVAWPPTPAEAHDDPLAERRAALVAALDADAAPPAARPLIEAPVRIRRPSRAVDANIETMSRTGAGRREPARARLDAPVPGEARCAPGPGPGRGAQGLGTGHEPVHKSNVASPPRRLLDGVAVWSFTGRFNQESPIDLRTGTNRKRCYVGNLPPKLDNVEAVLRQLFGHHGTIDEVLLLPGRNFGFVTFATEEAAQAMIDAPKPTLTAAGRTCQLRVERERERPELDRPPSPSSPRSLKSAPLGNSAFDPTPTASRAKMRVDAFAKNVGLDEASITALVALSPRDQVRLVRRLEARGFAPGEDAGALVRASIQAGTNFAATKEELLVLASTLQKTADAAALRSETVALLATIGAREQGRVAQHLCSQQHIFQGRDVDDFIATCFDEEGIYGHGLMSRLLGTYHAGYVAMANHSPPPRAQECPGCRVRSRNTACVPCGHTFCELCANRLGKRACPTCGLLIKSTLRVFLS